MRENGVAQLGIRQVCSHRGLHHDHDFTGFGTDHGETENPVVTPSDKSLHEPLRFVGRLRPQDSARRQSRHPHGDALAPRVAFGQSDAGEWRLREHAVRNQPIPRAALRPGQIVPDDPKVVARYVRELGTPSAFPDRPDPGGTRLEPLVEHECSPDHPAGRRPPRARSRRCSECARCDQDVAALDVSLAGGRAHDQADFVPGSAVHMEDLGLYEKEDAFVTENPLHLLRDVGILTTHELRPTLDDRDAAPEATVRLAQFETDVATAEHDQMRRHVVELESLYYW